MKYYLLALGYSKNKEYYSSLYQDFVKSTCISCEFVWLDNKDNNLHYKCSEYKSYQCVGSNIHFEFSGYISLLASIIDNVCSDDVVIMINDTATDHHSFDIWLKAIVSIKNKIEPGCVYGDLRKFNTKSLAYRYFASWIFILKGADIVTYTNALSCTILLSSKVSFYYGEDQPINYASHLKGERRLKLMNWLFNDNPLRGWIYSKSFHLMEKSTRFRKGLTIQLEHDLSLALKKSKISLVDIKDLTFWGRLGNFIDRLKNLKKRLTYRMGIAN